MVNRFVVESYPAFLLAWSGDWPGLVCGAPSEVALQNAMPRSIAEHAAWLASHGEAGPADLEWDVAATIDSRDAAPTEGDSFYVTDLDPLSPADFERFVRHARFSQEDLAASVAALPDLLLDWVPDGLALEHADPWAPDPRTIRGILTHALQLEVFYREGLHDGPAAGIFEQVQAPAEEQRRTLEILRDAARHDPDRVFHPIRPSASRTAPPPGDWTIRKALRRLISHNRAHAAEIVQRRTWVLLGPPNGPI